MKIFYSASLGGFLNSNVYREFPADVVELTLDEHAALLNGQSQGMLISSDESGRPVLVAPPVDTSPERYARDIAARRYQAETAGTTIDGNALDTGRDSQALITGAALAAMLDPNYSCQWKTAGGFIKLAAPQLLAIATAMRAHVQACFDREAQLLAALEAGTFTETMLDQGWPA